jgi:hypothetical protein
MSNLKVTILYKSLSRKVFGLNRENLKKILI